MSKVIRLETEEEPGRFFDMKDQKKPQVSSNSDRDFRCDYKIKTGILFIRKNRKSIKK